jgi:hypothetical protein
VARIPDRYLSILSLLSETTTAMLNAAHFSDSSRARWHDGDRDSLLHFSDSSRARWPGLLAPPLLRLVDDEGDFSRRLICSF